MTRREFVQNLGCAWLALHTRLSQVSAVAEASPSPHFRRITLRTPRLDGLKNFYRPILGFETNEADDSLIVHAGSTALRFVQDDQVQSPLYHFAFNIPENKIQSCMDWASAKVELVKHPRTGQHLIHFPNWNAHSIYFWDPAGNLVEFIARHTLRNATAGGFDIPRDVICASELGVVTGDVAALDAELSNRLKIGRYAPPADGKLPNDFRAMGDEHGLFIVVRKNRRWFMTAAGAQAFPSEVLVDVSDASGNFELGDTLCHVNVNAKEKR